MGGRGINRSGSGQRFVAGYVHMIMNLQVPHDVGSFLTGCGIIRF